MGDTESTPEFLQALAKDAAKAGKEVFCGKIRADNVHSLVLLRK